MDNAVGARSQSNHTPVLQHLTANGTGPDKELAVVGDLLLERLSKDGDLTIITRSRRLAFSLRRKSGGKGFQGVKVQMLNQWVELGRTGFQGLLSDEAPNDSDDWGNITRGLVR